ncbi:hypothetical protein WJX82_003733 [Trebouxia sp. C0006]
MAFFLEARRNWTWDRWLDVTLQWHQEISGLINALNTPVGAMANLLPPHLLVVRMLEPVKEALRTQKEPSTVLNSRIWKMAGQVLMDNPNCPVETYGAADVLPMNMSGGIAIVYPGHSGEPYWTEWMGKFVSVSDYPTYDHLLREWDTGIVYSDGLKRTVPMAELEQDKAEGKQVESSAYES